MSDDPSTALFADEESRPHRPGLMPLLLAVIALAIASYAAISIRRIDDRLVALAAQANQQATAHAMLADELSALAEREALATTETRKQLEALLSLSRDVAALENTTTALEDRMALPQRSWARAEALALLELAQRQLKVDRNIDAALDAMVTADTRLAGLREPALSTVRKQLTADLQTLRSFAQPDIGAITLQLRQAEIDATTLATAGVTAIPTVAAPTTAAVEQGPVDRAWTLARQAVMGLITVRSTAAGADALLTRDEQNLKRLRMQLLLLEARLAIARTDQKAFAAAIVEARTWLEGNFHASDAGVVKLVAELTQLEQVNIAPPLPDVSSSLRLLEQMVPLTRAGA